MDEEMVNGLIGTLNLGLIISKAADENLIHIPREDAIELIMCLETLRNYIQKG